MWSRAVDGRDGMAREGNDTVRVRVRVKGGEKKVRNFGSYLFRL